jgi:hypothetical protein
MSLFSPTHNPVNLLCVPQYSTNRQIEAVLSHATFSQTRLALECWMVLQRKGAPRPNWSGFMQDVTSGSGTHPPVADIRMLPIIDMNPGDKSCILSTLSFICDDTTPAQLIFLKCNRRR